MIFQDRGVVVLDSGLCQESWCFKYKLRIRNIMRLDGNKEEVER